MIALAVLFEWSSASFAGNNTVDPREAAIDRAVGGMEEGSRPLSPKNYSGKNHTQKIPGNKLSPSLDTRVTASANIQNASASNASGNGSGALPNGTQETVSGGTAGGTESGTHTESTTEPSTESVTEPITEPVSEPTSGTSAGDGIIQVDAGVDLSGGAPAVDANLAVDTNAGGGLLDANATTTTDTVTTDVTATESGQIAGEDLTAAVENAPVDAVLDAEIVSTDIPPETEATAGLEASVDATSAGSDVTPADPADGLIL